MKVKIVTEGGNNIGFGHITRCSALYEAFEEKEIPIQMFINGDSSIESLLNGKKYHIFNWLEQKKQFYKKFKSSDIVIIDSYLADYDFYKYISDFTKFSAYFDDYGRINYPKGTIINGAIFSEEIYDSLDEQHHYLLGSNFIPLRKVFWDVPEKK
mgnify:FL=1